MIRYNSGVRERYWLMDGDLPPKHDRLDRAGARLSVDISPNVVTGRGPTITRRNSVGERTVAAGCLAADGDYSYVVVGAKSWQSASTMERALAVQRFLAETCARGHQWRLPAESLRQKLAAWRECDFDRPLRYDRFGRPCIGRAPVVGRDVIWHFFDVSDLSRPYAGITPADAATKPRIVYRIVRLLGGNPSSASVMRKIRQTYAPRLANIAQYTCLLRHVGASSVYDPHPETGCKAMACAGLGIPYYTGRSPRFEAALACGFSSAIGLDHRMLGDGRPDVALVDFNLSGFDYGAALDYAGSADRLIIRVPGESVADAMDVCTPTMSIPIAVHLDGHDRLFVW